MEKEQLNQTTTNEAEVKQAEKKEDNNFAEIRQKIENRYNEKLSKAQAEFTAQLELANKELEFYKKQLPELEKAFVKNGGNQSYFNDWLALNREKVDFNDLDSYIKKSFEVNQWAKKTDGFSVSKTLNNGAAEKRYLDLDELYPGTVYKKLK